MKWKNYIVEFFVIFLGISISFFLDDYREKEIMKNELHFALKSLSKSIRNDIEELEKDTTNCNWHIRELGNWVNPDYRPTLDSVHYHYRAIMSFLYFQSDRAGYSVYLEAEGKYLLKNDNLRSLINNYYFDYAVSCEKSAQRIEEFQKNFFYQAIYEKGIVPILPLENYSTNKTIINTKYNLVVQQLRSYYNNYKYTIKLSLKNMYELEKQLLEEIAIN